MPKTENLKGAKSTNPKWLDTARSFYADSFGALRLRELRGAREDWSDLTEEEQSFALAHLQYLDLMAQAGTQRLLVQIRDVLEEVADLLAAGRDVPVDATGDEDDDDNYNDDYGDEHGDPDPGVEPQPRVQAQPPFTHPVPRAVPLPMAHLEADPDDQDPESEFYQPIDRSDDGGRAA